MFLTWNCHVAQLGLPVQARQERMYPLVTFLGHLLERYNVDEVVPFPHRKLLHQLQQLQLVRLAPGSLVMELFLQLIATSRPEVANLLSRLQLTRQGITIPTGQKKLPI